jgi:glyoxylase-like metal-dependent hydrolase (beta-lactamase superfamily II)
VGVVAPGHTEGSTIYRVGDRIVLTGDTLFVDGVGRPDLAERAEEYSHSLYRSLHERVLTLADETLVLPAHYGPDVRVRPDEPVSAHLRELRTALTPLGLDESEFVAWATASATPRPPNYVEIINANMGRSDLPTTELARLEIGPNRCAL